MTRYLDRFNGVWIHEPVVHKSHPWLLVAKSATHGQLGFTIGSRQNHASVIALAPFTNIETDTKVVGTTFTFPLEDPEQGDIVWIDYDWLGEFAAENMIEYIGSPARIGGIVKNAHVLDDNITVTVDILVPKDKVTKQ